MTMYANACAFLREILAEGPRHSVEVIAAAERAGINYGAVLLAARAVAHGDDLWRLKPAARPSACGSVE